MMTRGNFYLLIYNSPKKYSPMSKREREHEVEKQLSRHILANSELSPRWYHISQMVNHLRQVSLEKVHQK
jgi:hypothetical protein